MKNYLLLLRVNLKTLLRGSLTEGARNDKGKLKISYIILYFVAALGFAVMGGMVIFLETTLYRALADFSAASGIQMDQLLIGLSLLLSMVVTLIFGVFHTMGAMYFNRDTAATAHLPIGARTQMAARWTEIYLSEVLFSLAILLPMLINHGIAQGGGVMYYIRAVVTLLATPLYPLAIALLLSSVLARFTSLTRHKEVWTVLFTIVLLVLVLGGEWMLMPQIPDDADAVFFLRLIQDNEALLTFLIGAFPPVIWALQAVNGSFLMLLLYAAVGAAAIALVIFLMGGSFQQVCLKHTEQGTRRKAGLRLIRGREEYRAASPFMAIFRREMNEVLKTPIYLLNAVLGVLMMPIMLVAMSVGMTSGDSGIDVMELLTMALGEISNIDLMLVLTAIFSLMVLMCPITCTAISREGKRLPTMRMIPVRTSTIIWAKIMVGQAIIAVGSVVMGVAIVILLGAEYLHVVLGAVLLSNAHACAVGIANILADVIHPVLSWKSENEVMKQNMNTLLSMLISVVLTAVVAVPVVLLYAQAAWVRLVVALALLALEIGLMLLVLYRVAAPRLSRLEP